MPILTTNSKLKKAWPDPVASTYVQRDILLQKPSFLEWHRTVYRMVCAELAAGSKHLEIGAGSSFLYEHIPGLIKANVLHVRDNDITFDAYNIPFKEDSLDNIIIINVLHHLNDPFEFFYEAHRVLKAGGRILISDPYISCLSSLMWRYLHPENCDMSRPGFNIVKGNPLQEANSATATILFCNDPKIFPERCKGFSVIKCKFHTTFHYWLAGGYNFPSLVPMCALRIVTALEKVFSPLSPLLASFIFVIIEKR